MKFKIQYLFILLLFSFTLTTCSKYEDGCVSLRSAHQRALNAWGVEKFYVDGIDSTEYLLSKIYWVGPTGYPHYCSYYLLEDGIQGGACVEGIWHLTNNNKNLTTFLKDSSHFPGPFLAKGVTIEWEILKLCDKEFNIRTNYNGKTYESHLVEVED